MQYRNKMPAIWFCSAYIGAFSPLRLVQCILWVWDTMKQIQYSKGIRKQGDKASVMLNPMCLAQEHS